MQTVSRCARPIHAGMTRIHATASPYLLLYSGLARVTWTAVRVHF